MNRQSIISLLVSGLLVLISLQLPAEELEGKIVSPLTGESQSSSSNSSNIANLSSVANVASPDMSTSLDPVPHFVVEEIQKNISQLGDQHGDRFDSFALIPIVAIITVFGGSFTFILILVGMRYRAKAQHRLQRQEQIQRFIDAGRDVPNELLRDSDSSLDHEANLAKGIKDTLVGLALLVFLTALLGFNIGAVGLIIVAVGLSRIIIWKISQSKQSSN